MTKSKIFLATCSLMLFAFSGTVAFAYDLNGAWSSGGACENIFVRKDKLISFLPEAEAYGSGFIVQGDLIRGRAVRCTIKSRSEKGPVHRLSAICSTDIMIDRVQISYKVVDQNRIVRVIPGGVEIEFTRCGSLGGQ
jgi:hypothetical protein